MLFGTVEHVFVRHFRFTVRSLECALAAKSSMPPHGAVDIRHAGMSELQDLLNHIVLLWMVSMEGGMDALEGEVSWV